MSGKNKNSAKTKPTPQPILNAIKIGPGGSVNMYETPANTTKKKGVNR